MVELELFLAHCQTSSVSYWICGKEVGADGTTHLQVYIYYKNAVLFLYPELRNVGSAEYIQDTYDGSNWKSFDDLMNRNLNEKLIGLP